MNTKFVVLCNFLSINVLRIIVTDITVTAVAISIVFTYTAYQA